MAPVDFDVFHHLREILIAELPISSERVNLYNQKFKIPPDKGMYVVIERGPSKVISSQSRPVPDTEGLVEEMEVYSRDTYIVGVFSQSLEAMDRKEEVVMALGSIYAEQVQEKYSFKIARNMPIEDLSFLEGAAILYRFNVTVQVFSSKKKTVRREFYDTFTARVRANDGQPDLVKDIEQNIEEP